jgi:hypothetical protein
MEPVTTLPMWAQWSVAIFGVAASIAMCLAAYAAVRSVNAWRQEHASKAEYTVAIQALVSLYRLKRSIYSLLEDASNLLATIKQWPNHRPYASAETSIEPRLMEFESAWLTVVAVCSLDNSDTKVVETLLNQVSTLISHCGEIDSMHDLPEGSAYKRQQIEEPKNQIKAWTAKDNNNLKLISDSEKVFQKIIIKYKHLKHK